MCSVHQFHFYGHFVWCIPPIQHRFSLYLAMFSWSSIVSIKLCVCCSNANDFAVLFLDGTGTHFECHPKYVHVRCSCYRCNVSKQPKHLYRIWCTIKNMILLDFEWEIMWTEWIGDEEEMRRDGRKIKFNIFYDFKMGTFFSVFEMVCRGLYAFHTNRKTIYIIKFHSE